MEENDIFLSLPTKSVQNSSKKLDKYLLSKGDKQSKNILFLFLFSFWELPQIVTITLLRMSNCLYMEWFPATNFHIKSCHNSDNYLLSKGDKKSLKVTYHSDFFTPPPTPNLLNPNILAPMVQGFELRDLQFKAGSINDNYRVFILPCCKIVHSSLEISLEEFLFYGISQGSPYSNSFLGFGE